MAKTIGLAALIMSLAGPASAITTTTCKVGPTATSTACVKAPEIDASSAIAGLTLLLGGLAVLRGYRAKSPKA